MFNVKNFIFQNEPSAWGYRVDEKIGFDPQIIEITDDSTGEPTQVARENIPMYVNEVGHNPSLEQNVLSLLKDDCIVHYYLDMKEINKGETVELLVDYSADCWLNLHKGLNGDWHEPSANCRAFREKSDVVDLIVESLSIMQFSELVTFLKQRIVEPVRTATSSLFRGRAQITETSRRQLIACR